MTKDMLLKAAQGHLVLRAHYEARGNLTRAKRHEILQRYYEKQAEKHDDAGD